MSVCIEWVPQEDPRGGGIAALAMLTNQTYRQVAADFAQPLEDGFIHDLNKEGPSLLSIDRYLAERGLAVCRLYLRDLFAPRPVWPPEPFAEVHLCEVKVRPTSRYIHWVIMLEDGRVLDPNMPEPKRLTDYHVNSVAAVFPVRAAKSSPVQRVQQEHSCGCSIAALAMLTGQTYGQVAADFARPQEDGFIHNLTRQGPEALSVDRYLAERGFALCRLYLRDLFGPRPEWPPEPFAEVHLCSVKYLQNSRAAHAVVLLGDGRMLDPRLREPLLLSDYYLVYEVAAVVRLPGDPFQSSIPKNAWHVRL